MRKLQTKANMNNDSLTQLQVKAHDFMLQYQKQITQRQYQKQKIKQSVMLDILSMRNKTQNSQSSQKDNILNFQDMNNRVHQNIVNRSQKQTYSEQRNLSKLTNKSGMGRSQSVPSQENDLNTMQNVGPQITFKANGNQKSQFMNIQKQNQFQLQQNEIENSNASMRKSKASQKQMTFREQKQPSSSQYTAKKSFLKNQEKFKFTEPEVQQESDPEETQQIQQLHKQDDYHNSKYGYVSKYGNMKQNLDDYHLDDQIQLSTNPIPQQTHNQSNKYSQIHKKKRQAPLQRQSYQVENLQQEIQVQQENKKGVFLTVDEDESMQVTHEIQGGKALSFDIQMQKSQPIQNIQQLRKKKIQEMDRKRQQRMVQHKRQESLKKPDIPVHNTLRNNSYSKKSQTKISEDPEPQPVKPASKKKIQSQKRIPNPPVQESHYGLKSTHNPSQNPSQRGSYYIPHGRSERNDNQSQQLINQTPKTISSQQRQNKSRNKTTIFRQSPRRLQKSSHKYSQQPKIEPKDRKNTFTKQSNKKLMINAVTYVCFPGELNRKQREKLIQVIENEPAQFLVFLFKQYSRKVIKAIYILDHSQSYLQRVYGDKAPPEIVSDQVKTFYRFDSGSRQFKKLDGCKSFSFSVHAIDLK